MIVLVKLSPRKIMVLNISTEARNWTLASVNDVPARGLGIEHASEVQVVLKAGTYREALEAATKFESARERLITNDQHRAKWFGR